MGRLLALSTKGDFNLFCGCLCVCMCVDACVCTHVHGMGTRGLHQLSFLIILLLIRWVGISQLDPDRVHHFCEVGESYWPMDGHLCFPSTSIIGKPPHPLCGIWVGSEDTNWGLRACTTSVTHPLCHHPHPQSWLYSFYGKRETWNPSDSHIHLLSKMDGRPELLREFKCSALSFLEP